MLVSTLSVFIEQVRLTSTMSGHLRPLFAVDQDEAQLFMGCDGPLGCLSDLLDSLFLEHLDQILLNPAFNHSCVLLGWAVDDWNLVGCLRHICIVKLLPALRISEIEVHQDGIVRLLSVDPDVVAADDRVDLPQGADRVCKTNIQMTLLAIADATEFVRLDDIIEVVALSSERVP